MARGGLRKRDIIGKTIIGYDPGLFPAGRMSGAKWGHDPRIILSDGSTLRFLVEETEDGYGVQIIHLKGKEKKGRNGGHDR